MSMKNIKFRAWDKENNQWYSPTFEAYKGNLHELFISLSGGLSAHTMAGMEDESLWPNKFKLSQYTGENDKNGKEIFEGDIVDHEDTYPGNLPEFHRYVVEFGGGSFYLRSFVDPEYNDLLNIGPLEIVGNVYENPQLLK